MSSPVKVRKRKHDEVGDSDEEVSSEYGWLDADADAIAAEGLIDESTIVEKDSNSATIAG